MRNQSTDHYIRIRDAFVFREKKEQEEPEEEDIDE